MESQNGAAEDVVVVVDSNTVTVTLALRLHTMIRLFGPIVH
jgi:hypothetical protein